MNGTQRERSLIVKSLRQPLLHFVLLAGVIFALYTWRADDQSEPNERTIVITDDDLLQMTVALRAQGLPPPTESQLLSLIEARVREEVLYREALALGLDVNDTIVKRRMVQKMDFLAEDLSDLREPTAQELREWLASRPDEFAVPPRVSFRHVYFAFDARRGSAESDAATALSVVTSLAVDAPEIDSAGDQFMFQDVYADRTPVEVTSIFGPEFASDVFGVDQGVWVGPIESGFGWHLVNVTSFVPSRIPEYEEVETEVRASWTEHQRESAKAAVYEVMRDKYDVVLPEFLTDRAAGAAMAPGDSDGR